MQYFQHGRKGKHPPLRHMENSKPVTTSKRPAGAFNPADFLHFANNLTQVMSAFEANQQDAIDALRSAFDRLRSVAQN